MKAARWTGLLAGLMLVLAAAPRAAAEPADEIRALLGAQVAAWNRGDLDGFMDAYWRSDELRFASGGNITKGWAPTLEHYRKSYPDRTAMGHLNFSILEVNVVAPDAAVVFGRWELVREKDRPAGLFTLVLRHRAEGWRIVSDHTSSGG